MPKDLKQQILTDMRIELTEEFDRNFERKAFFTRRWPARKVETKGSLLVKTGKLRRSIRSRVVNNGVMFTSSEPYAAIQNEGGTITITPKMKRFFWAKYYELGGKIRYKKSGGMSKSSMRLSEEAEMYHALALKKVGSTITIPERRFIGEAPEVRACVKRIVTDNIKITVQTAFKNQLKRKK